MSKDTIYLESDDEITAVIDKLESSPQKVVAFVLPKRTAVFQSVVNMRLLERASKKAKKSVVLITSDDAVVGVSAVAKLHVAKSLHSKPAIPSVPKISPDNSTITMGEAVATPEKASGESDKKDPLSDNAIELDNSEDTSEKPSTQDTASKKSKKLKIPDFGSFRVKLFLALFVFILLIIGSVFAFYILPKATITISTNSSSFEMVVPLTITTDAEEFNAEEAVVPATLVEVTKTDTDVFPATGEKNVGERATGQVRFFNCNRDDKVEEIVRTIPAGTTISSGGFNFVTQNSASVEPSKFSGNTCQFDKSSGLVDVEASQPGDQYNLAPRTYTVGGFATITADDDDGMGGGTNVLVKVVRQEDIDNARQQLAGRSRTDAVEEMVGLLGSRQKLEITESVVQSDSTVTNNPALDAESETVTVTAVTRYSMLGVDGSNLEQLLDSAIEERAEEEQQLQDNGFESAIFRVVNQESPTVQRLSMETVASVGPNIDVEELARESAGKRRGDIQSDIGRIRGVTDVRVDYSPFWVLQTPNRANRIFIVIDQAGE